MKILVLALVVVSTISCYGNFFDREIGLERRGQVIEKCHPIDLAIILDSSRSMRRSDWRKVKDFAKKLVDSISDVSKDWNHVAIMTFSKEAALNVSFNEYKSGNMDAKRVKARIDSLVQMSESTFLDKALKLADKEVFTTEAGMRANKKIKKIIVLMTDGVQTIHLEPYTPLIEASHPLIKDKGVEILTIGVGTDISIHQLADMSSSLDNIYSSLTFDDLVYSVDQLKVETCDCYEPLDIGFILDGSSSIDQENVRYGRPTRNFNKAKAAVVQLLKQLRVGPGDGDSHFGLVLFSKKDKFKVVYRLSDNQNMDVAESVIEEIKLPGGSTYTWQALNAAGDSFFKPGTKGNRGNVRDIAIILTDGVSNDQKGCCNFKYLTEKIDVFAVGVGDKVSKANLKELARNKENNVIMVDNYDKLAAKLDEIVKKVCSKEKKKQS